MELIETDWLKVRAEKQKGFKVGRPKKRGRPKSMKRKEIKRGFGSDPNFDEESDDDDLVFDASAMAE